ncbi:MAG TPA: hypothetical protein VMM84_08515 [Pyrinomonadaceae bacterium]|nr:hypothetical protein [Pyrinomonadaceae bacterium]
MRSDDKEGDKQPHAHHGAMLALEKEAWPIALSINGHHAGLHNRGDVFDKMPKYLSKARAAADTLHESDASWSLPEVMEVIPHWLKDLTFNGSEKLGRLDGHRVVHTIFVQRTDRCRPA